MTISPQANNPGAPRPDSGTWDGARRNSTPRKILVLGATSGIAEATCRIWAAQGASLFLVARNQERLNAVAADLRIRGAHYIGTAAADLDDTAAHPDLLAHAINSLAGLDVAFLAYGILGDQPKGEADFAEADQILHTNLVSPVSLLTWLANFCVQRHAGVLAVISSVAGDRGRKSNYVYGASKGGLNIFLDGVRNRIDRAGVNVLTIKPGFVATPMTVRLPQGPLFAQPARVARYILRAIEKRKDVVYVPPFWGLIMLIVRSIPRRIFKKMNM